MAAGFSMIYGQANILFFAIGEIYMLGAVLTYTLMVFAGLPYFIALAISVFVLGLFGVILQKYFFHYLEGENPLSFAFASLALGMLIVGIALEIFGEQGKAIEAPLSGVLNIFGIILPKDKLMLIIIALLIIFALKYFLKLTKIGRGIRAVSQDEEGARLVGVPVGYTKRLTFFLSLATAAAGGGLIAPVFYVDVFMGSPVLMKTLTVVVLGGLGSFSGAIVGGLFIGLVESFGYTFLGGITTLASFIIVMIVLVLKPAGLFGYE